MMEEKDYILVPKYQLDIVQAYILQVMKCLSNERRIDIMQNFCSHCGAINTSDNLTHCSCWKED